MIIGHNPAMMRIKKMARGIAKEEGPVLLSGETGTGKEFIAREIHKRSRRRNKPFIPVSCTDFDVIIREPDFVGSITEQSGGIKREFGFFEKAAGGTLYLGNIEDLPQTFQKRLLSILRQSRFYRLGDPRPSTTDFRLMAGTTNTELIRHPGFRTDLYAYISKYLINIPPLRSRKQDIPLLFNHFIKATAKTGNRALPGLPSIIFDSIMEYTWPGNVSELKNTARNLVLMSPEGELASEYLPFEIKMHPLEFLERFPLKEAVEQVEHYLIKQSLRRFAGNQSKAAKDLGISEAAFRYKMKKFGITRNNFRSG